jgi:hypothetical protein
MRIFLDMIGCRLNQSEIEGFANLFRALGHQVVGDPAQADVAIVNTCAVTVKAAADSRKKLRRASREGARLVIATGCWATLEPQAALNLEGVQSVCVNDQKDGLVAEILGITPENIATIKLVREPLPGDRGRTRAFIKVQEGFRLWVDMPNFLIWSVPGLNFKDTRVYTKAQKTAGPDNNLYGVICRYQDQQNYYAFMISSDGYYGIYRRQAGIISRMGLTQMGFSEAILRGDQTNEILALCQGDQLVLYVNDIKLLQVTDDTFTHGDVGLVAGNLTTPGTDILFNYFIVLKP